MDHIDDRDRPAVSGDVIDLPVDDILARIHFNDEGLVPAIAQSHDSGRVLMMAWMDESAVRATVETHRATYFSRSRGSQWVKGETSGHHQHVRALFIDCDGDTILLQVDQTGSACHTGATSCFDVGGPDDR